MPPPDRVCRSQTLCAACLLCTSVTTGRLSARQTCPPCSSVTTRRPPTHAGPEPLRPTSQPVAFGRPPRDAVACDPAPMTASAVAPKVHVDVTLPH
jgi:hypothetical protein